jgi:PHP family Zn ribbon phosphoesterase
MYCGHSLIARNIRTGKYYCTECFKDFLIEEVLRKNYSCEDCKKWGETICGNDTLQMRCFERR